MKWSNELRKLETQRLFLRPFVEKDAKAVEILAGDYDVYDMTLNIPHPYSLEDAMNWINKHQERFEKESKLIYAISTKTDHTLIGGINLDVNLRHNRGEFGYWIGKPYWNQGYCTEALSAILNLGFKQLELNKICASHISRNPASGRVMVKNGMKHEGTLRDHMKKDNHYESLELYGILDEEYKKSIAALNAT